MIGGETGRPVANSTGPGTAIPIPHSAPGHAVGRREQLVEQLLDPPEPDLRAGLDLRRLVAMAEDPPVERHDRHVDARRAEVRDQDVPGPGLERQLARRPAAGRRPRVALDHEPPLDQLPHPLGDDGPPEPGPLDQLRARLRSPETDLVEDEDERVQRLVGERAGHARIIRTFCSPQPHFCT